MSEAGTLGYLLEDNYQLGLHCEAPECHHFAWANMASLVHRLGADHSYLAPDLAGKFRCAECGGRNVAIRLHGSSVRGGTTHYIVPPGGG